VSGIKLRVVLVLFAYKPETLAAHHRFIYAVFCKRNLISWSLPETLLFTKPFLQRTCLKMIS